MALISLLILAAAVSCEFVFSLQLDQLKARFGRFYNTRIVGGENAESGQFKYIVSLQVQDQHFCGGTIVSPNWILTAAHCLAGSIEATDITIKAGNIYYKSGTPYTAKRKIVHAEYSRAKLQNDIGMLETEKTIEFNDLVQPAEFSRTIVDSDVEVVLIGWGYTSYPGRASDTLKYLYLRTDSNEHCKSIWESRYNVSSKQICTLPPRGKGGCKGDSGGPLAIGNTVVGVVSYGQPCAQGYPDVYARVSSYYDWILDRMRNVDN